MSETIEFNGAEAVFFLELERREKKEIAKHEARTAVIFDWLDRREKAEVSRLHNLIKEAQSIEEGLQAEYVKLTGNRCL